MPIRFLPLLVAVSIAFHPLSALAHDPIIITDDQTTSATGPFLPDGTVSFALYGSVTRAGDARAFRVGFVEGDRLHLSLLIPDLPPENELSTEDLPYLTVLDPLGGLTELRPDRRTTFAEPFSGTNYVEILDVVDVALGGVYTVTVVGNGPARFTVSVGDRETFGTPVEGVTDRSLGIGGVMDWYDNPPPTSAVVPSTTSSTSSTTDPMPAPASTTSPTSLPEQTSSGTNNDSNAGIVAVVALAATAVIGIGLAARRRGRSSRR